ncbi:MIP family Ig-specific serine endopeptidase [Mesomycoplasma hyopneumoniae]|uniref:DUF31 domain-containing protein n=1 Tax=Mesomycoplasma hyopneumoniae TaxID=2099 RepID=A0ABD4SUT3_MESHO|nr:DUF31 family protein [Mesomycoplasma hyopneumoniae]MCI8282997.1 hypothetical protein [Mesomycoplasma hyopneumoniae]MCI8298575.1 hypothetical protein [Mesomycoplasma hyopneumoniae]
MKRIKNFLFLAIIPAFFFLISCKNDKVSEKQISNEIKETKKEEKNENIDSKTQKKQVEALPDKSQANPNNSLQLPDVFHQLPQFATKNLKANEYPLFAKKYKAVDPQILYKELYDRTFSVKFGITLAKGVKLYGEPVENKFLATENGTIWLLDYHKKDENNYKLFFATNLHVASHLSNTLDENLGKKLNYEDPSKDKATSISLGKSIQAPQIFASHNNNYDFSTNKNNQAKFYASDENFTNANRSGLSANSTIKTTAFSAPKLIFAGYDFINRDYIKPFQDDIKNKSKLRLEYLKSQLEPEEDFTESKIIKSSLEKDEFIPLYTDFAVFELEVNLANADVTLKDWIKKAIAALDSYLKRNKQVDLPNQDKKISFYMPTIDYVTASKMQENKEFLTNSKNVYVLGYPGIDGGNSVLTWNNPIERNDKTMQSYHRSPENANTFAISTNDYEGKMLSFNLNPYTKVFHRLLGDYYGFNQNIKFSSLYFGASGSLVYNEFGQMIGVYSGVALSSNRWDLLARASYTPFLLSKDLSDGEKTIKAYNLIDGSNLQKFPSQTRSYRQNLKEIYPNGFENGDRKTALFPDGI